MAELPELETLRRELEKEAVGKRFKAPEVSTPKAVARNSNKKVFGARLEGAKVRSVDRRARFLSANLDSGDLLLVDLAANGRLEKVTPKDPVDKATMVTLTFTQGGTLRLVDPDGDSQIWLATPAELAESGLVAGGLDPVADAVSWTSFARLLLGRSAKVKAVLTDPEVVAAIGPIYSDEILYEAGLRHDRTSDSLSSQEIRRLYRALVETLHEAVKHRGTTTDEFPFADLYGAPGEYQDELKVHDREGEPCRRCRAPIQKARFQNRPVYYCAQCQV
jgi:formamidopyrimidine-DNA glycosylase